MTSSFGDDVVYQFLNEFNNYHMSSASSEMLYDFKLKDSNAFYWFNVTLPGNLLKHQKNIECLDAIHGVRSVMGFLYYMVSNLETILERIDTSSVEVLLLPLDVKRNKPQSVVNLIQLSKWSAPKITKQEPLPYPEVEVMEDVVPLNRTREALIIAKLLEICPTLVYYPTDKDKYPIQRAIMYNLFQKIGIPLHDDSFVTSEINKNIKTFVNSLPTHIDVSASNKIMQKLMYNPDDKYTSILLTCLNSYQLANKRPPDQYHELLESFEATIIPTFATKLNISIEIENSDINYPFNKPTCETDKHCTEANISSNTILSLLMNYPNLLNGSTTIESLQLCPYQVSFIINTFPYCSNHILFMNGSEVSFERIIEPDKVDMKNDKFNQLKKMVSFNGNYDLFKSIVEVVPFTGDEVINLLPLLYENVGFKCSTIIAELANYHINSYYNTRAMFSLLSKLSVKEQTQLENILPCRVEFLNEDHIYDVIKFILDSPYPMIKLNTDTIDKALEYMTQLANVEERMIMASSTNFSTLALLQKFKEAIDKDAIDKVLLLLLFSDISLQHKTILMSVLPKQVDFPANHKFVDMNELSVPDVNNSLIPLMSKYCSRGLCSSVIDYYKKTKDDSTLYFINGGDSMYEEPLLE
ncbi:hypothetical protein PvNV_069 [Penaeus vannamei nudivirus]|nr:hypothetical protein PvSNPV_069 [Penaeus vannamei nucleopolyhedrovirus]